MPPVAIILLSVTGALLLLFLIWFFLTAAKPVRKEKSMPFLRPYAHRGLYDKESVPENSLPAFRRAAEAGIAIELDVQLSADGEVFVFHDYNLKRMCGKDMLLSDTPRRRAEKHAPCGHGTHHPHLCRGPLGSGGARAAPD